jgi:protein O-mannosyl-transferase
LHPDTLICRLVRALAAKAELTSGKSAASLGCALLLAALLAAYGNHFYNSFHFDDAHTIENNVAIRELRNIPLFFQDATTFSSLPSNQSYRPLVSTLLAVDYQLAGGLRPFWFHLSVFAFFVPLILLLGFVVHRFLEINVASSRNGWLAIAAAGWYGLHPANADTVNYVIASAEVIATLGVVASFALYFAFPRLRPYFLYTLPAAVTILAKPPAAIFAVLFAIFRLLFPDETIKGRAGKRRLLAWLTEVLPPFLICAATLLFVQHMTPRTWVAGATNARNYLITQPYVALLYLKTFFWPSGLSADYDLAPFATTDDARFWTGFVFAAVIAAVSITGCVFKKTRLIAFGLLWFLVSLLPTSLFPLAEVMNDHRAFLPFIGLVIAMAGVASLLINREVQYPIAAKVAAVCATIVFLSANGYATRERNKVWKSEESLWHDVATKDPGNARGLMNYGVALMARDNLTGALDYFHRARALAPQYPVLLINLAIAEATAKQLRQAEQHFREALRLGPSIPDSYTYYARWLLSQNRIAEARPLLQRALELSPTDLTAQELLARTEGRTPGATLTAESYLALGLRYYLEERYAESITASRSALALRPGYAEAWNNIGAVYNRLRRYEKGIAACREALRLKPGFQLAQNNLQYARQMLKESGK